MKKALPLALVLTLATGQISAAIEGAAGVGRSSRVNETTARAVVRLSPNVVPSRYLLTIAPNLAAGAFAGQERIELNVNESSPQISLHAKDLTITAASIKALPEKKGANGKRLGTQRAMALQTRLDKENDLLIVTQNERAFSPGNYELALSFQGKLNEKLVGFYRSSFVDKKGTKHNLAVTQMEATDARRMFPCFDEPSFKAKFKLTAVIDPTDEAISNAPVAKRTINAKSRRKIVEFAETGKMSTYLLALMVGKFESSAPQVVSGIPIRVWSVKGKVGMGIYAQQLAARLLPYFNSYFKIPYPWKKLDLIALPDFESGAMENPGAITFREALLLVDGQSASIDALRDVASVLAHEMAHMWFGDLVTMKWWDDLWLNEAFATWMSIKAIDALLPEWKFYMGYVNSRVHSMETDSLRSTRPIHFKVVNPEQVNEMFDVITYSKGAAILRMLEHFVGESTFQEGVHLYLKRFSWSNATTEDLWNSIATVARRPISEVMHGWVYQPGYPLLSLAGGEAGNVSVRQWRFLLEQSRGGADVDQSMWQVPLGLRSLEGKFVEAKEVPSTPLLLSQKEQTLSTSMSFPFNANAGAIGYYRVQYSKDQLEKLKPLIGIAMNPAERIGLLNDQFAAVVAGSAQIDQWFQLLPAYANERDYSVWETIIGQIYRLDYFVDRSARGSYEKFISAQVAPIWAKLGWDERAGESDLDKLLRGRVITLLGTLGQDRAVIAQARKMLNLYVKTGSLVDPDLLDAITTIVAYNGNEQDFSTLYNLYKKACTPEIERRNLMALADFRLPSLIDKTLALTLDSSVRSQDAPRLLSSLMSADAARHKAWQFVKKNWSKIKSSYPEQMVPYVVGHAALTDWVGYEDLKEFFLNHKVKSGEHAVARMLERTSIAAGFSQRSGKRLNAWLQEHFPAQ